MKIALRTGAKLVPMWGFGTQLMGLGLGLWKAAAACYRAELWSELWSELLWSELWSELWPGCQVKTISTRIWQ